MRNASGHQCKVKMSGSEKKVNENTYDISSIKRVTKKFLEVSRCSRAKQRQRNVQKKCAARAKLLFLLIRPIVVFHRSPALPSPLSITRFIFCLNKLLILSRASLLALAKSIYYIKTKKISRSFQLRRCIYNTDMRKRDFAPDPARGRLINQNAL